MFHKKLILTGLLSASCLFQGLGHLLAPLATQAQTSLPTIVPASGQGVTVEKSKLQEIVNGYGLTPVNCGSGTTSSIEYGTDKVCVLPSTQLPLGNYVFDPNRNEIAPVTQLTEIQPSSAMQPNTVNSANTHLGIADVSLTFRTLGEYIDCVQDVLDLYEGRLNTHNSVRRHQCTTEIKRVFGNQPLTRSQAYELLDLANFQATQLQNPQFFPPQGLRNRAAELLNYTY